MEEGKLLQMKYILVVFKQNIGRGKEQQKMDREWIANQTPFAILIIRM